MKRPCKWPTNFGQCAVPAELKSGAVRAVAVEAGTLFSLALLADGSARAWGSWGEVSPTGQAQRMPAALPDLLASPPASKKVVAIAAGSEGYALLADGSLIAFGPSYEGNYTVLLTNVISMKVRCCELPLFTAATSLLSRTRSSAPGPPPVQVATARVPAADPF